MNKQASKAWGHLAVHSSRGDNTSRCIGPEARAHLACFRNSTDVSGDAQGRVSESKLGSAGRRGAPWVLRATVKSQVWHWTVIVTVREPGHKSGQTFPLEFFSFSKEHTAGDRNASRETGDLWLLQSPKEGDSSLDLGRGWVRMWPVATFRK